MIFIHRPASFFFHELYRIIQIARTVLKILSAWQTRLNIRKYEYIEFPQTDTWGLIIPASDPLAKKKAIRLDDLKDLPLFCSDQAWDGDIKNRAGNRFSELNLEGSFRPSYNGSIFTREGLGYLLTYNVLLFSNLLDPIIFNILFSFNKITTFEGGYSTNIGQLSVISH